MRTENNMQAVDSGCAQCTQQTLLYLNAMFFKLISAS